MKNKCPACGTKWENHLGITGTCQKLRDVQKVLIVIKDWCKNDPSDLAESIKKLIDYELNK